MEELRLKLIEDCNASELPIEAILFVVRDVYRDVSETFDKFQKQKIENKKIEQEENK